MGKRVRVSVETVGEKFLDTSEGLESDSALGGVWKLIKLEGVRDSNRVFNGDGFSGRHGEVTKGEGDGRSSGGGDVGVHGLGGRPKGQRV